MKDFEYQNNILKSLILSLKSTAYLDVGDAIKQ